MATPDIPALTRACDLAFSNMAKYMDEIPVVHRSPEQAHRMHVLHQEALEARDRLERAEFWADYDARKAEAVNG